MSNYPPGVTGNEPEIAGGVLLNVSRDCESERFEVVEATRVIRALKGVRAHLRTTLDTPRYGFGPTPRAEWEESMLTQVNEALTMVNDLITEVEEAAWEQRVDYACEEKIDEEVQVFGTTAEVQCPRCGTCHYEEIHP